MCVCVGVSEGIVFSGFVFMIFKQKLKAKRLFWGSPKTMRSHLGSASYTFQSVRFRPLHQLAHPFRIGKEQPIGTGSGKLKPYCI